MSGSFQLEVGDASHSEGAKGGDSCFWECHKGGMLAEIHEFHEEEYVFCWFCICFRGLKLVELFVIRTLFG